MLHEAFRHDLRHHLGGVVDALAPAVAQREREDCGDTDYGGLNPHDLRHCVEMEAKSKILDRQ